MTPEIGYLVRYEVFNSRNSVWNPARTEVFKTEGLARESKERIEGTYGDKARHVRIMMSVTSETELES